jgi:hypothetical protein
MVSGCQLDRQYMKHKRISGIEDYFVINIKHSIVINKLALP